RCAPPLFERMIPARYQRKKFITRIFAIPKRPQHGAHNRARMLFFHAAHHHAKVPRFADHAHSYRLQHILKRLRDLLCQPFLQLEPPGEHVHDAGNFAQPDHFVLRQITYVDLAEKRQHVMLAHREKFDIPDDHHLVAFVRKQSAVDDLGQIHLIATGQKPQRFFHAVRRPEQALARGIFPQFGQDLTHIRRNRIVVVLGLHHLHHCFCVLHDRNSKMFFFVSCSRNPASADPPSGNSLRQARRSLCSIDCKMFSDVGIASENSGTSRLKSAWSKRAITSPRTRRSSAPVLTNRPVRSSTAPVTLTSKTQLCPCPNEV